MAAGGNPAHTDSPPSPRPLRWLANGLLAVVSLLLVGGIVLIFHWPFSSEKILQALQQRWPGTVKVQEFHRTYFPHPGCILKNVTLTRGSNASTSPLMAIQEVDIEANYHDLLFRPGYMARVELQGSKIAVPEDKVEGESTHGGSDSSGPSVRLGEVIAKDLTLEVARKDDAPLRFEIRQLLLRSVSKDTAMSYDLKMRNAEPPGEIGAHGKLGPWTMDHLENIPVSGFYTFDHADLSVFEGIAGTLASKGEFRGPLGQIEIQGTTETPDFEVTRTKHTVPLRAKFDAVVDGTSGNTTLHSVEASFLHTIALVEGSVSSQGAQHGKTASLNITVRAGHIDDVLRLFVRENKPPMEGTTNFRTRVVLPTGHKPFLNRVRLEGDFHIENAEWEQYGRQTNINLLSKRASGKKDDPNVDRVTADIKGRVLLNDGIAKFSEVSFKVPGAEATMHGSYNLRNTKIDFRGELKTEAEVSKASTGTKAVLLKPLDPLFKRKHAGAVVPVEMTGSYTDPHFGVALPVKK